MGRPPPPRTYRFQAEETSRCPPVDDGVDGGVACEVASQGGRVRGPATRQMAYEDVAKVAVCGPLGGGRSLRRLPGSACWRRRESGEDDVPGLMMEPPADRGKAVSEPAITNAPTQPPHDARQGNTAAYLPHDTTAPIPSGDGRSRRASALVAPAFEGRAESRL
eukprot:CAMPEP_0172551646 /NCGR_PEP_ID=MMETSP1067-20121228/40121_1 /TAXON_ID=265564 ORGANISM="Thalassiosira punctigera, Strain Tpunct2005C2" /NCGR_SAMPLE_ID=MMETSP1067 /ASSEMBLY_ACC=CAM_ASM_000444 /LENGTH=163 /DNA_ID=CAMNT_0013339455 /DNA_START=342 /DNA_END=834 /DNA_ORIENTATION=+